MGEVVGTALPSCCVEIDFSSLEISTTVSLLFGVGVGCLLRLFREVLDEGTFERQWVF